MNIKHELNRAGERSKWEPFGPFWFDRISKRPPSGTKLIAKVDVYRVFPGSVDRAFEKMYADD
jgi:hypothetical protein